MVLRSHLTSAGPSPSVLEVLGATAPCGTRQTSVGKTNRPCDHPVANTDQRPTDIGLHCQWTAHPARPALRRFTCVRYSHTPTTSTRPSLAGKDHRLTAPVFTGPCLIGVGFPPSGSRDRIHLQSVGHATRTTALAGKTRKGRASPSSQLMRGVMRSTTTKGVSCQGCTSTRRNR